MLKGRFVPQAELQAADVEREGELQRQAEREAAIEELTSSRLNPARKQEFLSEQALVDMVAGLNNMSPAEIDAWVESNTGNLNTPAKTALKLILKVLAIDRRR